MEFKPFAEKTNCRILAGLRNRNVDKIAADFLARLRNLNLKKRTERGKITLAELPTQNLFRNVGRASLRKKKADRKRKYERRIKRTKKH